MSSINKILAISNNFPTTRFPEKGVFVLNILKEMNRQGIEVDIIAPMSLGTEFKRLFRKRVKLDFGDLNVQQPYYLAIPQRFSAFRKWIAAVNDFFFGMALKSKYKQKSYDFVYCHFLQSAIPIFKYLSLGSSKVMVNIGESDMDYYNPYYSKNKLHTWLHQIAFIVSVSKMNFDYLQSLDSNFLKKMQYIPNGVNTNVFKPHEKIASRKKLGLDLKELYVIFCGHLDARKGPLRVLEAIRGTGIKGIFIGSNGPDVPSGPEVAFLGSVKNEDVPYYLSASDVFVLPSKSEGMSNAVLEAMACCVPLVVSNRPFNTDFLTEDMAVFVDPDSIEAIRAGILTAIKPTKNIQMRGALSQKRMKYSIEARIKSLLDFASKDI